MTAEELLFALLRHAVCGQPLDHSIQEYCTNEMLEAVCALAQKHDVAHLAGHGVEKLELPSSEPLARLRDAKKQAVFRYLRQDYEFGRICSTLEQARIAYIPLKGAVVRALYPEPWMRTSCDIDILVHEEDLETAVKLLVSRLSYSTDGKKHYHDVSLISGSGIHLELHFSIRENTAGIDKLLSQVWNYARPAAGCRYELEHEFLVFHLLAHMSYHFTGGGCGIRPFMDIFLLRQQIHDKTVLAGYLTQCGIGRFHEGVQALIDVWFGGQPHSQITEQMQSYLLGGGVYGNEEQRIAVQQKRTGGKLGYLLNRVFLPYRDLKYRYRILEKYPLLYPAMLIRRWIEWLLSGRLTQSAREFDVIRRSGKDRVEQINALLERLGLQ